MEREKKKGWQQHIGTAFMMLMGAICGVIIVWYIDKSSADTLYQRLLLFAGLFLGTYAALFFHIIVHEAGHLVFGLLTGYRFSSFRIASLLLLKENGKWKWKRLSIVGTGGQCLMAPPDINDGKMPLVLYNLGGSLSNTVTGALCLFGYLIWSDIPLLSPLLLIFAVVGFIIALMNGIPLRMGTVDNDGYNAFALSKNKEATEAFWVQLKVAEQTAKGVRLRDMPDEWFAVPTDEAMKNSMVAVRGVFACNKLMDEEKFEQADALMAHLLEIESGMVGLHRSLLICDRIFAELIGENRGDVIGCMLTKEQLAFMKAMKSYPSVIRTQYALALLSERDPEKAETLKNELEKVARTYPYPHEIDSERELLRIAQRARSEAIES